MGFWPRSTYLVASPSRKKHSLYTVRFPCCLSISLYLLHKSIACFSTNICIYLFLLHMNEREMCWFLVAPSCISPPRILNSVCFDPSHFKWRSNSNVNGKPLTCYSDYSILFLFYSLINNNKRRTTTDSTQTTTTRISSN